VKTFLVTGGTGYVGREIVRQLRAHGKEVTVLSRSAPDGDLPFIQADCTDRAALDRALGDRRFDAVIHAASLPGDTGDPLQMVSVNIDGLQNMLQFAVRSKAQRFVLTSSVSAYEWYPATKFKAPDYQPVDEEHPCRPRDMYSTTKRMQELLALTYWHQFQLPVVVLRLTAVVGPGGRGGGRGWREFAQQLAGGMLVQIPHFSEEELCHYVDLRDVGRMHIVAAEHPNAVGEVFNCCGPGPTRGSEFAVIVRQLVPGIRVECGFPWSMAQGGEISFSMEKARRLIGFVPELTLEDAVGSIKEWVDAGGLEDSAGSTERFDGGIRSAER
jgi:nucleoside-diphosphate-sugar epimerase